MSVQQFFSNKYQNSIPKLEQMVLSLPTEKWNSIKTKHFAKYLWNQWKNNSEFNRSLLPLCVRTVHFFGSLRCLHLSKNPKWASRILDIFKNINFQNSDSLVVLLNISSVGNIHLYKLLCKEINPQEGLRLQGLNDPFPLILEHEGVHGVPKCLTHLTQAGIQIEKAKEMIWRKACILGRLEILIELVDKFSFSPQSVDQNQEHAIHIAAYFGHTEIILHCLENNWCPIDIANASQCTALHIACKQGHKQTVESLIEKGSNIQAISKNGWTVFHFACLSGKMKLVQRLLSNNTIKSDSKTLLGSTGVHIACMAGDIKLLRFLVQHCGLSPHEKEKFGATPLHFALVREQNEVAEVLVKEYHADPNAQNQDGNTPLHISCSGEDSKLVQFFLACPHINLLSFNNLGLTAFDVAVARMTELQAKTASLRPQALMNLYSPFGDISSSYLQIEEMAGQIAEQMKILTMITSYCLDHAENSCQEIRKENINHEIVVKYLISIGQVTVVLSITNPQNPYFNPLVKKSIKLMSFLYRDSLIEKVINNLKEELTELDKKLEDLEKIPAVLERLKEIKNLLFLFKRSFKLISSYIEDHIGTCLAPLDEILRRLIEKCQSKNNINNPQNSYDERDSLGILAEQFGIGVSEGNFRASAEDSYVNFLGVEGPRIYQCGIMEGKDLRALGISPELRETIVKILELKDLQDLSAACKNANDLFNSFVSQMRCLPPSLQDKLKNFQKNGHELFQNMYQCLQENRPFLEIEFLLRKFIDEEKLFKIELLKAYLTQSQQLPDIICSYSSSGEAQISQLNLPLQNLYSLQLANRGIKREVPQKPKGT